MSVVPLYLSRSDIGSRTDTDANSIPSNWKDTITLSVIDGDFRPIIPGLILVEVKRNESYPFNDISIDQAYDPFDKDKDSVSFQTWKAPVPYSKPLYIYKTGNGIKLTLEKEDGVEDPLSPLYVLAEKDYKFKMEQGRCFPNPSGYSFSKCAEENTAFLHKLGQPTILNLLKSRETGGSIIPYIIIFLIASVLLFAILKMNMVI